MATAGNSCARRALIWILAQSIAPEFIATHLAIAPEIDRRKFRSTVSSLIQQKRLYTSRNNAGKTVLHVADGALVDRRRLNGRARGAKLSAVRKAAAKKQAVAAPLRQSKASSANAPLQPAPGLVTRSGLNALFLQPETKRIERDQLTTDLAKFLAKGGQIEKLAHGESAASIAEAQQRFLTARRGIGEKPPRSQRAA